MRLTKIGKNLAPYNGSLLAKSEVGRRQPQDDYNNAT